MGKANCLHMYFIAISANQLLKKKKPFNEQYRYNGIPIHDIALSFRTTLEVLQNILGLDQTLMSANATQTWYAPTTDRPAAYQLPEPLLYIPACVKCGM